MGIKVKLKDIIGNMEFNSDENRSFLNIKTGEILALTSEEIRMADSDIDYARIPEWQKESIEAAKDLEENFEDYIELPDKYEINEYGMMEDFCSNIGDERISDALYNAIRGKGAFRRFKDTLSRFNIEDRWYAYYEDALREVAIEWCEDNEIDFE